MADSKAMTGLFLGLEGDDLGKLFKRGTGPWLRELTAEEFDQVMNERAGVRETRRTAMDECRG